jgi:hypothetical protein
VLIAAARTGAALATGSVAAGSAFLMRPLPLVMTFAVGGFYGWLRLRGRKARSDYSTLDRLLHRIVLGPAWMGEMLFDIDGAVAGKPAPQDSRPVFVTGLARAGTTVLMRALHGTGAFASLTYADMPMVMAPNLWASISGVSKKRRQTVERAHGDGVMVDFDAPEALEEVFWRTYCADDYIAADGLRPHTPDEETLAAYRLYQDRVCRRYGAPRYLAKNNNLMLRLGPLARAMPDATFLVTVREPLAQAESLRRQHARFGQVDLFTRDYMGWLAHHEFGPQLRPFLLPGQAAPTGDPAGIDYWLSQWIACYAYVADVVAAGPPNLVVVNYERLCADPSTFAEVIARCDLPLGAEGGFRMAPALETDAANADPVLLARARAIYVQLLTLGGGSPKTPKNRVTA